MDAESDVIEKLKSLRAKSDVIWTARIIRAARQSGSYTQTELATFLQSSVGGISNIERLLNLPPIWIKRVEAGVLPSCHARDLVPHQRNQELMSIIEKKYFPKQLHRASPLPPAKEFHNEVKALAAKLRRAARPKLNTDGKRNCNPVC